MVFPFALVCVGTRGAYRVWQRVWYSQDLQTHFFSVGLYFVLLTTPY